MIPGYQIVREIGRGGMGAVYEAYHETLQVSCALKVIRTDRVSDRFLGRFRREARTMVTLDHPHIARIFEYAETEDGPYFTMKYLPDGTLEKRKGQYKNRSRDAVLLMKAVAEAVAYLHAKGFVHRDLKPQNILFEGDKPFVSDFGLVTEQGDVTAAASDDSTADLPSPGLAMRIETRPASLSPTPHLTASDGVIGTLPYMSPEQLENPRPKLSNACDIWALGVMLYELVCGERPFTAPDDHSLSERIRKAEKPPPLRITGLLDERLAAILSRCLAKAPGDRYPSAKALVEDLEAWAAPSTTNRWFYALPVAVVFLALLPLATPLLKSAPAPAPDSSAELGSPVESARTALAAGKPFTLVGQKGWPIAGYRVLDGLPGEVRLDDGTLAIASLAFHNTELLESPGADQFVYRVQVRHDPINRTRSRVGMYLFRETVAVPSGTVQPYLEFSITEEWDAGQRNSGFCELTWWARRDFRDDARNTAYPNFASMKYKRPFPRAAGDASPWHDLAVEVRAADLRFFLDGRALFTVPRAMPEGWVESLNNASFVDGLFSHDRPLRGGLGLAVRQGSAHFRNARLEPIPEN